MKKTVADYPEIAAQWHSLKNGSLMPSMVSAGSKNKVWWKCSVADDHEWIARVYCRKKYGCPCCAGQKVVNSNCLSVLRPEIAKQWHPIKNGNLMPNMVTAGSNRKVWWKCSVADDHEWKTTIRDRTHGRGCPYCARCNHKVSFSNCLATTHSNLAKQWHPLKNGNVTPYMVRAGSNIKFWWKCPVSDDHEWEISPNKRTSMNSGRPCCAGQKVVNSNCLSVLRPEIAKQWHPTKNENITPEMVTIGCKKKVWWKCSKEKHEWMAAVCDRTKYGCPYCCESKGEKKILKILQEKRMPFKPQCRFSSCKFVASLPFDFALWHNKKVHLVEYQGQQHFHPVVFARSGKDPKKALVALQQRDAIKAQWAKERSIPFLAIPYWEKDVKQVIEKFLEENN